MKVIKLLADIVAILGSMVGASLIAANNGHQHAGYIAFIVAGIATYYLLHISKGSWSLKFITIYFFVVNILGLMRY